MIVPLTQTKSLTSDLKWIYCQPKHFVQSKKVVRSFNDYKKKTIKQKKYHDNHRYFL